MKLPSKHVVWLTLKYDDATYVISAPEHDRSVYTLYKEIKQGDYEVVGTSNNPLVLENKLYSGKYN